jgi:hypothetical protein
MTALREPKKAALVLTDDDRAVLSSLPDDERAVVEAATRRADSGRSTPRFARNRHVRAGRVGHAPASRARPSHCQSYLR